MRFKSHLTEAVLLKRHFRFLVDVALTDRKKRTLYCPNLGTLAHCDILGSRVWFSSANRISQGYLDAWELVEVNGGWLVSVNPDYSAILLREALECEQIQSLEGFRFLHSPLIANLGTGIEVLLKENGEQCFVHVQPVWNADERNDGYFPEQRGDGLSLLYDLMQLRESGHRTLLFYCAQHAGIKRIRPADNIDPTYGKVLQEAIQKGVEILAYGININLREMTLSEQIPVSLSEDIISK